MTSSESVFLIFVGIIAYIIILDENVGVYLTLVFKMFGINLQRWYWMFKYHPNNFVTTWIQNRKYDKIARSLYEELNKEDKNK